MLRVLASSAAALCAGLLLASLTPSSAAAQGRLAAPLPALIRIAPGSVSPGEVRIGSETGFAFVNESERSARVVFDRDSARRIRCEAGAETGRRGQFLLEPGSSLRCSSGGRDARYTVYRTTAHGVQSTRGRVRVE